MIVITKEKNEVFWQPFTGDGSASDFEIETDADGNVTGWITNGLDFVNIATDAGQVSVKIEI